MCYKEVKIFEPVKFTISRFNNLCQRELKAKGKNDRPYTAMTKMTHTSTNREPRRKKNQANQRKQLLRAKIKLPRINVRDLKKAKLKFR